MNGGGVQRDLEKGVVEKERHRDRLVNSYRNTYEQGVGEEVSREWGAGGRWRDRVMGLLKITSSSSLFLSLSLSITQTTHTHTQSHTYIHVTYSQLCLNLLSSSGCFFIIPVIFPTFPYRSLFCRCNFMFSFLLLVCSVQYRSFVMRILSRLLYTAHSAKAAKETHTSAREHDNPGRTLCLLTSVCIRL